MLRHSHHAGFLRAPIRTATVIAPCPGAATLACIASETYRQSSPVGSNVFSRGYSDAWSTHSSATVVPRDKTILKIAQAGSSIKAREDPDLPKVSNKVVGMEIRWLKDPMALSVRVGALLEEGNVALAAELARTAQRRRINTSVAWNHILGYAMEHGEHLAAFRFYNDVGRFSPFFFFFFFFFFFIKWIVLY